MKKVAEPQPTPSDPISHLEADKVGCLISTVAEVAHARLDLSEWGRRWTIRFLSRLVLR